jgi:hypothetical protein
VHAVEATQPLLYAGLRLQVEDAQTPIGEQPLGVEEEPEEPMTLARAAAGALELRLAAPAQLEATEAPVAARTAHLATGEAHAIAHTTDELSPAYGSPDGHRHPCPGLTRVIDLAGGASAMSASKLVKADL